MSVEGKKSSYRHHLVVYYESDEEMGGKGYAIAEFREKFFGRCYGVAEVTIEHLLTSDDNLQPLFDFILITITHAK